MGCYKRTDNGDIVSWPCGKKPDGHTFGSGIGSGANKALGSKGRKAKRKAKKEYKAEQKGYKKHYKALDRKMKDPTHPR